MAHAGEMRGDEVVGARSIFVSDLAEQPVFGLLLSARLEPDQGEAPVQPLAMQHEADLAVTHAGRGIIERLPRSAVPRLDRAGPAFQRRTMTPAISARRRQNALTRQEKRPF